ncbi:HlyD family type I secretion periplasmic adaptor subunit [Allohahella marinimesophila]|uniref:Membrane fusion protein (MFP) family protein n=1 Tax=Allohahella marinimesophila TaxID=1054972 RepID=A0ABP7NVK1_9GAMM
MSAVIKLFPTIGILSDRDIQAFQPAALEVEQTPASPIGRAIIWAIALLAVIAVAWSWFGHIDIIATAQGKIIPTERVKTIQPMETAQIATIHVKDGQRVKAGDPLITFDRTATEADVQRLSQQWANARAQALRLSSLASWLEGNRVTLPEIDTAGANDADFQRRLTQQQSRLDHEAQMFSTKMQGLEQELARLKAEKLMAESEKDRATRLTTILQERVQALQTLSQSKMGSRTQFLELKQQLVGVEQDAASQTARLQQIQASIAAINTQQQALLHESMSTTYSQLQEVSTEAEMLQQEVLKANQHHEQLVLTAPIDGTVQQLQVHTLKGVVTPAQELMQIVPAGSALEVEALILNQDIGFVELNQLAEIKVNTYNFTKYGVIDAELVSIDSDAIEDEQLGLVYKAIFKLKSESLGGQDRELLIAPGMGVTAEIKTGTRRLIEFFLSPLIKAGSESLGER